MLKQEALTQKIIGICIDVINELGAGFLESVYEKALLIAFEESGIKAKSQFPIDVYFRNHCVGKFFADIIVEDCVILELKSIKSLAKEHSAQLINYLNATGMDIGLLINFGNPHLDWKRLHGKKKN